VESSDDIFGLLLNELARGADSLKIRDTDVQTAEGAIAHAVDHDGRRLLLIPVADGTTLAEDAGSRGVTLTVRELVDGGRTRRYVSFRCEIPTLHQPFGLLCDEVVESIRRDASDPGRTSLTVLARWRNLLGPRRSELLGEGALLGLLVELRFLERLTADDPTALRWWTGPQGARYDFTGERCAAEVKGTSGRERFAVEIHGIGQLEPPEGGDLYLWAEQMERVPSGGDSVPDVIDRLVARNVDEHRLLTLLGGIGYTSADSASYSAIRFAPMATRAFLIGEGFPRLIRDSLADTGLADRITAVRYTVDLSDGHAISGSLDGPAEIVAALTGGS
jgi:hypothetical protein